MALTIRTAEPGGHTTLKTAACVRRWPEPDVVRLCDLHDLGARSYLTRQMVSDAVLVDGQGDRRWERWRPHCYAVARAPAARLAGPRDHRHTHLLDRRCLRQDHLVAELVELVCLGTLRRQRHDAVPGEAV